ncbi:hypothetical protein KH5H1_58340 [Corallococcus caeni]|nr:hypothetical protein KH5H1_58340 [Corallococcus sp. KH5-1]
MDSSSSGVKREMDSTPSRRLRQNSSTDAAPGKRPDMPMMAMAFDGSAAVPSVACADGTGAAVGTDSSGKDTDCVGTVAARALSPSRSSRRASPWTVGCSKSQTTGTSR